MPEATVEPVRASGLVKGQQTGEFSYLGEGGSAFILLRPSTYWIWLTHIMEAICFTESMDLMLISFNSTLKETPRIMFD